MRTVEALFQWPQFAAIAMVVLVAAIVGPVVAILVDGASPVSAQLGEPGYVFDDPEVAIELTASVVDWEVVAGEVVEAWTYDGTVPGPEIRVRLGQRVRVTLHNELPEATTIHWHGLDVPNDQDGVPGITQPAVEPGETWTYEFTPERAGTTVYHTHANTAQQLAKGLFGFFIVEPPEGLDYDREHSLMLHEMEGLFTINGHSFPKTLETDLLQIRTGERMLVRFANMGAAHHPMHLHGHQFEVLSIDGNPMPPGWRQNTVDIAPGQTVDVLIEGTNPGTWTFHCHIVPHVTNRGVYPGGMLLILDYEDHTSYFEEQAALAADAEPAASPEEAPAAEGTTDDPAAAPAADDAEQVVEVALRDFEIVPTEIRVEAGRPVRLRLRNEGSVLHDVTALDFVGDVDGLAGEAFATADEAFHASVRIGASGELLFTPTAAGSYQIFCSVPGHEALGMVATLVVEE